MNYRVLFKSDLEDILYINAVMDSYENIGLVRTLEREECIVAVYTSIEMIGIILRLLVELAREGVDVRSLYVSHVDERTIDEYDLYVTALNAYV